MRKRVLSLLTALCLVFSMIPVAFAEETESRAADSGTCGENLSWSFEPDTGVITISGTGPMTDYSHTSTNEIPWYHHASQITTVVVEEGVTTIGQAAFYQCSNLAELTLPSTLTSIGQHAFSYCAISQLELPDGLLSLGSFKSNPITELVIPDSVTSICDNAFQECMELTRVVLPAGLETCGQMVFSGCSQLSQVVMPQVPNLRYFNGGVFSGCALTDIDWYTHSQIGYEMFSSNDFVELEIPECVTSVDGFAFSECKTLTKVTVPASVTSLGDVAFAGCTALKEVYFLGDAPMLGVEPFQRLSGITCYYPADNETWTEEARNTYDGIVTWVAYDPDSGEVDPDQPTEPSEPQPDYIHSGVYNSNIHWSYNENTGLLSLSGAGEMPEPDDIFYPWDDYKYDYTHVDIGEDMTHIGVRCFASSAMLSEITIPGNVQFIGTAAFSYSSVRDVVIEEGVARIGDSAFYESGVRTVQLPSTISQMELVSTFQGCEDLTSVVIPNGVNVQTQLGVLCETFKGCSSLREVVLPDSLWSISVSTFEGCNQLTDIALPEGLEIIGDYAFADTASLTELTIPSTVTFIGDEAFGSVDWYDGEEFRHGITTIYFTGDAPTFSENSFAGYPDGHELTCCYPAGNATWTDEVMQQYGGNVTWIADGDEPEPSQPTEPEPTEPEPTDPEPTEPEPTEPEPTEPEPTEPEPTEPEPTEPVEPEPIENPFTDVKEGAFYYDPVLWAVSQGVTSGVSATRFAPNDPCTRAQVVTFLWRAAGEPQPTSTKNPFTDVNTSAYYYKAVLWAVENGITTGMSATSFGPNNPCTRGQVVTFLYRAAGGSGAYDGENPFQDVKSTDFYYNAVLWAVDYGITTGMTATTFAPGSTCTRGQVVTFLYRFLHS